MGIVLLIILSGIQDMQEIHPTDFLWKNRLIIISDPEAESPDRSVHFQLFQKRVADNKDRDVILVFLSKHQTWLHTSPTVTPTAIWLEHFALSPDFGGVVLAGKDGGLKFKAEQVTDPKTIYDLIDSMPMRQQEMKNRN